MDREKKCVEVGVKQSRNLLKKKKLAKQKRPDVAHFISDKVCVFFPDMILLGNTFLITSQMGVVLVLLALSHAFAKSCHRV